MALRAFATEPQRAAVLAESLRRGGIDTAGHLSLLRALLRAQRGQHALRRERRFAQANADCVVDRVRDRRNGRRERALACLLGTERAFGIDALDDDGLDLRRLGG